MVNQGEDYSNTYLHLQFRADRASWRNCIFEKLNAPCRASSVNESIEEQAIFHSAWTEKRGHSARKERCFRTVDAASYEISRGCFRHTIHRNYYTKVGVDCQGTHCNLMHERTSKTIDAFELANRRRFSQKIWAGEQLEAGESKSKYYLAAVIHNGSN